MFITAETTNLSVKARFFRGFSDPSRLKILEALRAGGAEVFVHSGYRVDLAQALGTLKELGVNRLMVEGGATLNFEMLRLGLVDEVQMYMAPMIFGGESAPTLAAGMGLERGAAIPLKLTDVETWEDGGVVLKYSIERLR